MRPVRWKRYSFVASDVHWPVATDCTTNHVHCLSISFGRLCTSSVCLLYLAIAALHTNTLVIIFNKKIYCSLCWWRSGARWVALGSLTPQRSSPALAFIHCPLRCSSFSTSLYRCLFSITLSVGHKRQYGVGRYHSLSTGH